MGIDLGADNYLNKPFNNLEIIARAKSILRRSYEFKVKNSEKDNIITIGEITLNYEDRIVIKNGVEVKFT